MSDLIRLGTGTIAAATLEGTSSYLVTNFPIQADMGSGDTWIAQQPNPPLLQNLIPSLEVGSGGYYGKFASQIEFSILTEDMRQYLHNTIMGGNPIAKVTAYLEHPLNGFGSYVGELITPYAANSQGGFSRYDASYYTRNIYLFQRASVVA